jgi:hypothetical protein
MANYWQGIVTAAAPEFVKGSLDRTVRKRLWMAMLNKRGLVRTGVDGSYEREYNVRYRKPPIESFGYGGQAVYNPRNYHKRAKMGWRGYITTDEMHVKEYEMLKNSQHKLVDRYGEAIPELISGMQNTFGEEFYVDGSAAGNDERFEGIETLFGSGGTVVAADLIAIPDTTYHNLDTDLHQAGTWTSDLGTKPNAALGYDWPEGSGDPEFDYNSPLHVKWDGTGWGGTTTVFEDQCIPVIRRTAQWMRQGGGMEGDTLVLMLAGALMTDFKAAHDSKLRSLLPHREAEDLGFPDVLNFEGVAIQSEWGVPVNTGYMVAIDNMKLEFITDEMIVTNGPTAMDAEAMSYRFNAYSFGNFTFSAKHCAKLYPFATT